MKLLNCMIFLLFFCLLNGLSIKTSQIKLFSWMNKNNKNQQLYLYKVNYNETTILQKMDQLPYNFMVEQNCKIIESETKSTIFQSIKKTKYKLDYLYIVENVIKNQGYLSFSQTYDLSLSQNLTVKLSKNLFNSQVSQQSSISTLQSLQQNNQLYINNYNDFQLYKFSKALYYIQPICNVFGKMTQSLCFDNQCETISAKQFLENQNSKILKVDNFILTQGQWIMNSYNSDQLNKQINIQFLQPTGNNSFIEANIEISQTNITMSNRTQQNIKVTIQNFVPINNNLREISNKIVQKFTVTIQNLLKKQIYNYIKILLGDQQLKFNLQVFIRSQIKQWTFQWPLLSDKTLSVHVQIFDQQLNLIKTVYFNRQTGNSDSLQQKVSQELPIINQYVEMISTLTYKQKLTLIITGSTVGASVIMLIIMFICRKRIKSTLKKICGLKKQESQIDGRNYQNQNQSGKKAEDNRSTNDEVVQSFETQSSLKNGNQEIDKNVFIDLKKQEKKYKSVHKDKQIKQKQHLDVSIVYEGQNNLNENKNNSINISIQNNHYSEYNNENNSKDLSTNPSLTSLIKDNNDQDNKIKIIKQRKHRKYNLRKSNSTRQSSNFSQNISHKQSLNHQVNQNPQDTNENQDLSVLKNEKTEDIDSKK